MRSALRLILCSLLWLALLLAVSLPALKAAQQVPSPGATPPDHESRSAAAKVVTRVNPKDGLTYLWIAPGKFMMGCSPGDSACDDDEKPAHEVTITKGFWIAQTLVTQAAYRRVMGKNPSLFQGDQLPVEKVTWAEAKAYCAAAGMRLPSEAEWEYAARATIPSARYGEPDAIAWYKDNSGGRTHAVGEKQPNPWQLFDMLGNVWEMTGDWYNEHYVALRGGSWDTSARNIRVSARGWDLPGHRRNFSGFRCVGE